ncbi:hypothetical protein ACGF12_06400 [Kitasatospora sp. NPDC048296]|uniref:hypothetical protein n=1 Tax=Kitasatospora sp. NPDC048296 TaxID=3364048 RepID=UPI003722DB66
MPIWRKSTHTSSSTARNSRSRPAGETGQWDDLSSFMQGYLNVEMAGPYYLLQIRRTIRSFPSYDALRRSFERMLAEQTMTCGEFCENTWLDFETDEEMYEYLGKIHAYLFLGQGEPPLPPD